MKREYALGLLTVLFWSTSATAFKLTLRYFDVLQLLFYASVTSVVVLGGYLWVRGRIRQVFRIPRNEYALYLLLGFLNPFVYYCMALAAYDLLPAQIVQPINYTWIITLSLLSVPLLKQRLTRVQICATLVCYSGVVVLSLGRSGATGAGLSYLGIFLAVSCTIIWALYWIFNVKSRQDPIIAIFLNFVFSLPFTGAACLIFSSLAPPSTEGLLGTVWIGCFEFGFAFITWISALRSSGDTNRVTNLIFLTPFISLIFIRTVLNEEILPQTYMGLALIIAGIVLQRYAEMRRVSRRPAA